ncbi:ABC-type antimicrobial peptide transport system, permease component [Rheinheimera sp. A13L]|uniref:ABC transporter permease n=1 Tax=Rheinheimera sp. A13L TaxID=506534 RepID=UPI0002124EF0|nr:ABC transporter permease [Rheinheimera sp. A13L]EGM77046.1 ABC-type antimicrobial peptide transport system, permease component [Rheinheimera sp. A13L]
MFVYQLKTAWKNLHRRRGFALSIVLTMSITLGILLNAVGLFYYLVLQPLPYPESEQLYKVEQLQIDKSGLPNVNAYGYASLMHLYQQQQQDQALFSSVGLAHYDDEVLVSHPAQPKLATSYITADFFQTLGAWPQLGQLFHPVSNPDLAEPVAVLSYSVWQSLYSADPDIIGKVLSIRGNSYKVAGVLAADFVEPALAQSGRQTAIWLPWHFNPATESIRSRWGDRANPRIFIGKLKADIPLQQAQQSLTDLVDRTWQQEVAAIPFYQGWRVEMKVSSLRQVIFGESNLAAYLLLAAAIALLLIATANIANLLLARAAERNKELALCAALGARPAQVRLILLSEIAVLMAISALIGWGISLVGRWFIRHNLPDVLPLSGYDSISYSPLLLAIALTLGLAMLFAWCSAKLLSLGQLNYRQLQAHLTSSGKGSAAQTPGTVRQALVYSQVAVAGFLLLVNLTFLLSAVSSIRDQQVFATADLLNLDVRLNTPQPLVPEQYNAVLSQLTTELRLLPQVEAVSRAMSPLVSASNTWSLIDERSQKTVLPQAQIVDEHFFQVTAQPLLEGQDFSKQQVQTADKALIINDVLARHLYPDGSAIGQRLSFDLSAGADASFTIIGVVQGLKKPGEATVPPRVYRPMNSGSSFTLVLKSGQQLQKHQLMATLQQVSDMLVIYQLDSLEQQKARLLKSQYLTAAAAIVLTLLSLLLAAVGLYGVIHYNVQLRTSEIGIRLALGASKHYIVRLFLRDNALPFFTGLLSSILLVLTVRGYLHQQVQHTMEQYLLELLLISAGSLICLSLCALLLPLRKCLQQSANQLIRSAQEGN